MDSTSDLIAPPRLAGFAKPKRDHGVAFLLTLMVAAGLLILFLFDPALHSFFPVCPFHKLTGLNCPGCGSTRGFHELLHGHIFAALRCNALVMLTSPLVIWLVARHWLARRRGGAARPFDFPAKWLWIFLGVTLVFAVLRNLPQFAWLSP